MRILTNYFQILTLAQAYNLSWEDNLQTFLESISFIAKATDIIISQNCFIRETVKDTHPIFIKVMIACLFPFIGIIILVIFWYIAGCCRKNMNYKNNLLMSVIILIYMCLPPLTSLAFDVFNCKDIFYDGNSYLVEDFGIQCWKDDHNLYSKMFGIPIILIWIIGIPAITFFILYKKKI
jgi:hypothetical protein